MVEKKGGGTDLNFLRIAVECWGHAHNFSDSVRRLGKGTQKKECPLLQGWEGNTVSPLKEETRERKSN